VGDAEKGATAEGSLQKETAALIEAGEPGRRRLRLLVAEGDPDSRVVLQDLLSKYGECRIAVNGREAVEAFRSARQEGRGYDLICMDIQLPEMNGQEAVYAIRSIEEHEKLYSSRSVKIFMTADIRNIRALSVTASFKALCDARLFKPIYAARLDEHLRSCGLVGRGPG
jgi:two-component system chemotaxis response regulator CheY